MQMFDATDVGIPHELWVFVSHRHETWRKELFLVSEINLRKL